MRAMFPLLDAIVTKAPSAFKTKAAVPIVVVREHKTRFAKSSFLNCVAIILVQAIRLTDCISYFDESFWYQHMWLLRSGRPTFEWRITVPSFVSSKTETKPMVTSLTGPIAAETDIISTLETPWAVIVQIVLNICPVATIAIYRWSRWQKGKIRDWFGRKSSG